MMNVDGSLRGAAAIVGASLGTPGPRPGLSALDIMADAATGALQEAGLTLKDVDGLFVGSAYHYLSTLSAAEYLGIQPRFSDNNMVVGYAFVAPPFTERKSGVEGKG